MKMKKRFISAAVLILALALGAGVWLKFGSAQREWRPGMPIGAEEIKIGVVYLTNAVTETSGFTYEHAEGIKEMARALDLRDDQVIIRYNVPDNNPPAIEHAFQELIISGVNIIFAASSGYMDTCEKFAALYPNVIFAHGTGYKNTDTNFTSYYGKIYQARYLSGIAAGLKTETNKIGYVAAMGMSDSQVTSGLDAFAMGVESVNPAAGVYVRVTNTWFDPGGEALAARALIDAGCDVIGQHCDTPAPQAEAARAGVWGIGYNSDMSLVVPDAVITSVVWRWGVYYTRLARSVIDGTFTTEPYFGGIAEGMVGITPPDEKLAAPGTQKAIDDAAWRIRSGELVIFSGEKETNDGKKVGSPRKHLTEIEIISAVKWYYRNITEM
jgi:basic membrane protein A